MFNYKILFVFLALVAIVIEGQLPGGVTQLSGKAFEEAKQTLESSLSKLATGDGPKFSLVKIVSATRQIVSGSLYNYETELKTDDGNTKKCHISIWSQPWLKNGIEVTFNCDGDTELKKHHSAK